LSFFACDPLDRGEPPTFAQGFSVSTISESQLMISWQPGSDDLIDPDELAYGIWFAQEGTELDITSGANFVTEEGALGFSLNGLRPGTTYQILVRARDRGNQYSDADADNIRTAPTLAKDDPGFGEDFPVDTTIQAEGLIGGVVFNGGRDDIGLIVGSEITWFQAQTTGNLVEEASTLNVGASIAEAHLEKIRTSPDWEDLLVLTDGALFYYKNSGSGFSERDEPFQGVPDVGSIRINYLNGIFETLSYAIANTGYIFTFNQTDETWDADPVTINLGNNGIFEMVDVDNDNDLDVVRFSAAGLAIDLNDSSDEDTLFDFSSTESVDSNQVRDVDQDTMLLADGNNDGNIDIYIFMRDDNSGKTTLRFYRGQGDGTFASAVDTDLAMRVYSDPAFINVDSSGGVEFVALQGSSNNVAIHNAGTSGTSQSVTRYLGGREQADFYFIGEIDDIAGLDTVVYSNQEGNRGFTVIPATLTDFDPDGDEDTAADSGGSQIP
jgi:hypothetical protein